MLSMVFMLISCAKLLFVQVAVCFKQFKRCKSHQMKHFTSVMSYLKNRSQKRIDTAAALSFCEVYDLCPFCTRTRMIFGLKKIPHRLIFMAYDDVETPTALIGKKLAPILHLHGEDPMPESLEIIQRVDETPSLSVL